MAQRALCICAKIGCNNLTREQYCELHKTQKKIRDDNRPSAHSRGYTAKWRKDRARHLIEHPWCEHCLKEGKHVIARQVDHIIPHRGDQLIFWDKTNWQSLCDTHHSRKTARGS